MGVYVVTRHVDYVTNMTAENAEEATQRMQAIDWDGDKSVRMQEAITLEASEDQIDLVNSDINALQGDVIVPASEEILEGEFTDITKPEDGRGPDFNESEAEQNASEAELDELDEELEEQASEAELEEVLQAAELSDSDEFPGAIAQASEPDGNVADEQSASEIEGLSEFESELEQAIAEESIQ